MSDKDEALLDELVQSARLLGRTEARKERGDYTDQDARFEVAMHQSIAKHRAAMLRSQHARIAELEAEVHNLNWALGTEGYESMATPEQQAEADAAHAAVLKNIEGMKKRRDRIAELEAVARAALEALESVHRGEVCYSDVTALIAAIREHLKDNK